MPRERKQDKPGRPPFQPTDAMRIAVKQMAAFGIPQKNMCVIIGAMARQDALDNDTLRKYFAHELDNGLQEAVVKVAGALFTNALSGNVAAQCFFLKTRAHWRETNHVEMTGPDGAPLPAATTVMPDPAMLEAACARAMEKYAIPQNDDPRA